MKIFIMHFNLGCCSNNSDGKVWIVAESEQEAIIIAEQNVSESITLIEEYNVENEIIFSSFGIKGTYRLKNKTDNWGEWRKPINKTK